MEAFKLHSHGYGEDNPLFFLDHVYKCLFQDANVLVAGLVSPSGKGVVYLGAAPLETGELDGYPPGCCLS